MTENVFIPQERTYQVGEVTLKQKPLPFKRLQEVLAIVSEAVKVLDQTTSANPGAELVKALPELLMTKFVELFPLLFKGVSLDKAWVEENISLPLAMQILADAIEINQIFDFFARLQGLRQPARVTEPKAPSTSAGSTIPSV